jgi:Tol biopolymer transport system component
MLLAFCSWDVNPVNISVITVDGADLRQLTHNKMELPEPSWNMSPAWSPDRRRIAFSSDNGENSEIYIVSTDGSGALRLTDDPADDYGPVWQPRE